MITRKKYNRDRMFSEKAPSSDDSTPPAQAKKPVRRRIDSLTIFARTTHAVSGARLYLARDKGDGAYIVAWAAPWQRSITDYHKVEKLAAARALYDVMVKEDPPTTPALCRDWQRNRLYAWEEDAIDAASPDIHPALMQNIADRIARDFNLAAAPTVTYRAPRKGDKPISYFFPGDNSIRMTHKQISAVIHEMAHAVDEKLYGNQWAAHGPSFVRTLIMLAEKYQFWLDPEKLEQSAKDAGLAVAPRNTARRGPAWAKSEYRPD